LIVFYCVTDTAGDVLKEHLMEKLDYSLVPEEGWVKFVEWYGMAPGSRPIARKVVEYGVYMKHLRVEVYLLEFKLAVHPEPNKHTIKEFSRVDTVGE
jgi:ubiquitin carboxyl-terminal hydrolase 4/11/15